MIRMNLSRAATAIEARHVGDDVEFIGCSTDSRTLQKDNLFIAISGEHFDGHDFIEQAEVQGAAALMLDKQVDHSIPVMRVPETRKAMGQLARAWRQELGIPVVAITGSNGKTTVKEMVKSILSGKADILATEGNLNNDIGVPLTLFRLGHQHQYAVVEMGANHPGEIAWLTSIARPNVAVITQCAPAHLEGFGSIDGVASAKAEIYSGLSQSGTAVINADDDYANYWKGTTGGNRQCTFGIDDPHADVRAAEISIDSATGSTQFKLLSKSGECLIRLPIPGRHNVMNALAAAACCLSLGIELAVIRSGLEKMHGVKGRLQIRQGLCGSRIIDDTYNANPTSLSAAITVLASYPGKRYLALGDMGELGSSAAAMHADAGKVARQAGINGLYTVGELSRHAGQSFGDGARHFSDVADLNESLCGQLTDNTTVLVKGSRSMHMERVVAALTEET